MVRQVHPGTEEVDLGGWKVTEEFVREYLRAVGDALPVYLQHGLTPPVALAARALGSVLEHLELPPGAVHSLQEIETVRPISIGQKITGTAALGLPRRRGGMEFITAGFTLKDQEGRQTLGGKSTVLIVDPSAVSRPGREPDREEDYARPGLSPAQGEEDSGGRTLPTVVRTITQEQLDSYAQVSGDHNPLHLDAGFAATTHFGGIIAHGMLTLAFVSEMMAAAFEGAWLETGALKVRFKGAAYLGDRVVAQGCVAKEESAPQGRRLGCTVRVSNQENGRELISGTAAVVLEEA